MELGPDIQNEANISAETDSDDEYYENPVEIIKEFGNHPLMAKAHKALYSELKQKEYNLSVKLLEKNDEYKNATQDREILGVQLYSLQQQLAKIQLSLENSQTQYSKLLDKRLKDEESFQHIESGNKEENFILDEHEKQKKNYLAELDSLHETLRQIDKYNQNIESEIYIKKRSAYKAEQNAQNIEKNIGLQDNYVDFLNNQVKSVQEQISIIMGQTSSQKTESEDANKIIDETLKEINMISDEKKQLMLQWKTAISGLSRRDEAIAQALKTLANAENAVHDYDMEIESAKRNQQNEQGKHETLVNIKDRLENELNWVEESLTKISIERDQLQERFSLLNKSLIQTTSESKKVELISKQLSIDAETILQNLQVVTLERQKLEEDLQLNIVTNANVNKSVLNLVKDQNKILKKIHEIENDINSIENEKARVRVEILSLTSLVDQLKNQFNVVQKDLKAKENLIEKYQIEIKQRTDEIEKKIYRVDRLNKKYDKMVESSGGEENLGPMENTIRNLNKEIEAINSECKSFEIDWLKKQTELVGVASQVEILFDANNELQARVTILNQQQLRLSNNLRFLKSEVKSSSQNNIELQKDVSKLNTLINSSQEKEGELQNNNYSLELTCLEELKDLERDSVNLQATINEVKLSKNKMLDQIIDEERQALLWEKKIQLDKETREALDPSVGQQEVLNMEKEIHRMEIRLDTLKKEQERLSNEMENAIVKRSTISNRYNKPSPNESYQSSELTQAKAKKRIKTLKNDARTIAEETVRYSTSITEKNDRIIETTSLFESLTTKFSELNQNNFGLQNNLNDFLYRKQLNQERISYHQKYFKRIKEISAVSIESSQHLNIERKLLSTLQSLENVKEILLGLSQLYPHLYEILERVLIMTDPSIKAMSKIL